MPLGTFIGSFWPTVDAERLGDTVLLPYLWTYLVFIIPDFLFLGSLFYIFALKTRSMMGMYLGVIGFFILLKILPETKGKSLEQIELELVKD